ncbi:tRNA lysidine(34) synthetase TilS [Catelliglobosispora koreensis]|uniref:tRNA lysidine(34) synthetase TilS n=1 Tax=Catelliglobosispora koreensis TaxID=129052 RepID=UPI0003795045
MRAVSPTGLVFVACSGGADSMALAAAARFVASRDGWRAGLITVDHQLQHDSAAVAASVAALPGFDPAIVVAVSVGTQGGPEAAAREARYEALARVALEHGASSVLLGHTEDDQAETVLLALTRGAGPRGLSGMPQTQVRHGMTFVRPFLGLSRATLREACYAQGLSIWDDPHNSDPAFTRSRLRLSKLTETLGDDVVPNLARSAALIAADSSYLDELAVTELEKLGDGPLDVTVLSTLPTPIRTRVLHLWAAALGAPRASLSHRHVAALDALVTRWHGQGAVALPGRVFVERRDGYLTRI